MHRKNARKTIGTGLGRFQNIAGQLIALGEIMTLESFKEAVAMKRIIKKPVSFLLSIMRMLS